MRRVILAGQIDPSMGVPSTILCAGDCQRSARRVCVGVARRSRRASEPSEICVRIGMRALAVRRPLRPRDTLDGGRHPLLNPVSRCLPSCLRQERHAHPLAPRVQRSACTSCSSDVLFFALPLVPPPHPCPLPSPFPSS